MNLCQNVCYYDKRTNLKVGHVWANTRALGQILEKSCIHSRRHSFDPIFMKPSQNVCQEMTFILTLCLPSDPIVN